MSVVLCEHLPLLAAAPHGIQKLRGLILELAMRGKLVPQDLKDEPASKLLKRIAQERVRLEELGACKKSRATPLVGVDDPPFELPPDWVWTNLATVSLINPRNTADDLTEASFVSMSMIGSRFEGSHQQEVRKWNEIKQGFTHFAEGDIGVAKITPCFENSKACMFAGLKNGIGAGTTELHVVRPIRQTLAPRFVLAYLKSPTFLAVGETKMTGTAGQKRLPRNFLEENPFPLPPLAEQHRIVSKVDELMVLCDKLEAEQADAETAHTELVDTLLGTLTQGANADSVAANWQRLAEHFDTIFTTESSIDALKQTILHLGAMGKLVLQDPIDKPASELLKQIAQKMAQLEADGIYKKTKPMPLLSEDEQPYVLPGSWAWTRLGEITNFGQTDKDGKINERTWVLDLEDIQKNTSVLLQKVRFAERKSKSDKNRFQSGDVLYGKLRPYLNKVIVADEGGICTTEILPVRGFCGVVPRFLMYALRRPDFLAYVNTKSYGMKMPRLGTEDGRLAVFPLPPEAEQHRIVAKIDELMALCDRLKADLVESRQHQKRLSSALIESALNAA